MNNIIPSLLAFPKEKWSEDLPKIQNKYQTVHFDVMDEQLVHNTAFERNDFQALIPYGFKVRVHLMVEKPWERVNDFLDLQTHSVTFQYEHLKKEDVLKTIKLIRQKGYLVGIAIKPTSTDYEQYLSECDLVTVMGVEPGFGGQPINWESLNILKMIANKYPNHELLIEFDGGVNDQTIDKLIPTPNLIVSGSYFYRELMKVK